MKKKVTLILTLLMIVLVSGASFAETGEDVYVVPISGEINKATYNFLRSTLKEISGKSAKAIIFEIDTYGGLIDEAEKIKNLIIDLDVPTISFVNKKAESAGVLLTISSENVVMASSSTIGSAETIPNTEKILSMWRSFLRDTAQLRGRNPQIIEAMADKDIYIEGLSEKGKLLNLTGNEAVEYGISDFIADDYDEILANLNISYNNVIEVEENIGLKFSKLLANPSFSTLFLTLGFVGMVVEILTPGFGFGGTVSILGFGFFFAGNFLVGNSEWVSLILFITGLILLIIEGIVPGFGLPGISGIILMSIGTILAMGNIVSGLISISIAILITTAIMILLIKYGKKTSKFDKIVLTASQGTDKGYISSLSKDEYLGKEGVSLSDLRPSGFVEIDGKKIDALSDRNFIPDKTAIKVVRVEGSKIFVRRV